MSWLAFGPFPVLPSLPILIWIGAILQKLLAKFRTSFGQVALNMRVYRSGLLTLEIMFLMSFSNPISSILSASSSTRYVHLLRLVSPAFKKSKSLPGVAIRISTPCLSWRCWSYLGAPPYTHSDLSWHMLAKILHCCSICIASSLVGAITRITGPSPLFKAV